MTDYREWTLTVKYHASDQNDSTWLVEMLRKECFSDEDLTGEFNKFVALTEHGGMEIVTVKFDLMEQVAHVMPYILMCTTPQQVRLIRNSDSVMRDGKGVRANG